MILMNIFDVKSIPGIDMLTNGIVNWQTMKPAMLPLVKIDTRDDSSGVRRLELPVSIGSVILVLTISHKPKLMEIERLVTSSETTEYEYYGNRTDHVHKYVVLDDIYKVLE